MISIHRNRTQGSAGHQPVLGWRRIIDELSRAQGAMLSTRPVKRLLPKRAACGLGPQRVARSSLGAVGPSEPEIEVGAVRRQRQGVVKRRLGACIVAWILVSKLKIQRAESRGKPGIERNASDPLFEFADANVDVATERGRFFGGTY